MPALITHFGLAAVKIWPWSIQFSVGYIGQGIITGPKVAFDMLLGAIIRAGMRTWISKNWIGRLLN